MASLRYGAKACINFGATGAIPNAGNWHAVKIPLHEAGHTNQIKDGSTTKQ
jgi:hypothetical protein